MKVIQSEGGPLIGINFKSASLWHGIDDLCFLREDQGFDNDYEALEAYVIKDPPVSVSVINSNNISAFLIVAPLQTAVIHGDGKSADIAQVFYADEDWGFDRVSRDFFDKADYDENIPFVVTEAKFTLFDAACPLDDKDRLEECLEFELAPGDYVISSALFHPDDSTELILYRIKPAGA